jgi:membrane-associated phospholipid phosphatase
MMYMHLGRSLVAVLLRADLCVLRICVASARPALGRGAAIIFSWMGNGVAYPILAAILLLTRGSHGRDVILIAAINIVLLHGLYPVIKKWTARPRPYQTHRDLTPLLKALDEHSFPSGHTMTLTAALVPIVLAVPEILSASITLWCVIAWARLACAHHYPSDVLAGTALALMVAYPLSSYCLSAAAIVWP